MNQRLQAGGNPDGAHEWKAWRIHLTDFASKIFR